MTRIARSVLLAAVLMLIGGTSMASPTGVTFTQSAVYVAPGVPVTYTAGAYVCDVPPCAEQWLVYGPGWSRLGSLIGSGRTLTKAWPAGQWLVQFRVTNSGRTHGVGSASAYTVVK